MVSIIIVSLIAVSALLVLVVGKRNYEVVRSYMDKDTNSVVRVTLKKFWRIEDALKFIDEYDWYSSDTSINLMNLSRKDGNIKVNGAVFNTGLVYFRSADGSCEGTSFASDLERQAIADILGYKVSEEA